MPSIHGIISREGENNKKKQTARPLSHIYIYIYI